MVNSIIFYICRITTFFLPYYKFCLTVLYFIYAEVQLLFYHTIIYCSACVVPVFSFIFISQSFLAISPSLISSYQLNRTGDGTLSPFLRLCAGSMAGIVAMSSVYPLEMIRGRLSIQEIGNKEYRGIWDAFKKICKTVSNSCRVLIYIN